MENQNQKKADAIYDARKLGRGRMLLLGLQHMFAMFGATVLVPILVNSYFHGEGLSVQVTLFMAGAGTLFFHLCSKFKVPAFLGSCSRISPCSAPPPSQNRREKRRKSRERPGP